MIESRGLQPLFGFERSSRGRGYFARLPPKEPKRDGHFDRRGIGVLIEVASDRPAVAHHEIRRVTQAGQRLVSITLLESRLSLQDVPGMVLDHLGKLGKVD